MNSRSLTLAAIALSTLLTNTGYAKKQDVSKKEPPKEIVSDETCAAFIAHKPGLNGLAVSVTSGILSVDTRVVNNTVDPFGANPSFDYPNKSKYKRFGFGLSYYHTQPNLVVWGLGLDLLTEFGQKASNGVASRNFLNRNNGNIIGTDLNVAVPGTHTQKRPFTVVVNGKLGYAYGNFTPYVAINISQSYVKHTFVPTDTTLPSKTETDMNIALEPGLGFMYKMGDFGFGGEVAYHKESTLGLEGYAENGGSVNNKGCYSVMGRISWFF